MSSLTTSSHSSSTMSFLVTTMMPFLTPSIVRISRCSFVCGMKPSSAATTSSTTSMPVAPTSMFFISFSWPGTSMILAVWPLGSVSCAKPISIVMPRRCSSFSRSVSTPVSALVRQVLPWSTWPAVPIIMCFIFPSPTVRRRPEPTPRRRAQTVSARRTAPRRGSPSR